jgi:outer membrane protein OmpA-like peptidoglycan-associated protein
MTFKAALLSATLLAAPLLLSHPARAQVVTGPYVAAGGGYNIEGSQKTKDTYVLSGQPLGEGKLLTKNGYDAEVSLGYGLGDGWRAEVEGDYISDGFDKLKIYGRDYGAKGTERRYGVFANALYDFDLGIPYLYPYVGAGVGWQEDDYHHLSTAGFHFNKERGSLAYQGIAGLAYPIAYVPGLSLTVEYRFVALANSRKFNGEYGGLPATFKNDHEYNNEINVGLRYQLFTPQPVPPAPAPEAPTPVAAPAPAPAKTYLVFFDWDKSDLTPRATAIIAQAASDSHTQNVTTLDVSGYTDTSGTPDYNQGLSLRRAQSVEAQLVSDGVPQSEISIHAYGETHLLVQTGPGVREPQNRRVEIVLD